MARPSSPLRLTFAMLIAVAGGVFVRHAAADESDKAKSIALFKRGRALMDKNDYAGACEAFEASNKLDTAPGTTLNLGVCHEQLKKWAEAWAEYSIAVNQAKAAKRDDRLQIAEEGLARLKKELSFVTITVDPANPSELALTLDGKPLERALVGIEFPIDPGTHVVDARFAKKKDWTTSLVVGELAKHETIAVPKLENDVPPPIVANTSAATPKTTMPTLVVQPKPQPPADQPVATTSSDHALGWTAICGCTPSWSCLNKCGLVTDNCGATHDCGGCTAPATCGGGGSSNVCGCSPAWNCTALCGLVVDSCGGDRDCGGCSTPNTCGGGGTANHCGCTPTTSCPSNLNCGSTSNECGGTITCGSCESGVTCTSNICDYGSLSDPNNWSLFDISASKGSHGFWGGAFDGRFVYLVPNNNGSFDGTVARYDTKGVGFAVGGAWQTFDLVGSVNPNAKGFAGAVFDGRYVYLVPDASSPGIITRYDTQASFASASSWTTFDVSTVASGAAKFVGAVFDGRYVYFVPNAGVSLGGVALRFDTGGSGFTNTAAWSALDLTTLAPNAKGFQGGLFDGRYVYLIPHAASASTYSGLIARYDSQGGGFASSSSWSFFDISTLNANATGFEGGVYDGRFIYLVPSSNGTPSGLVARYDTQGTLGSSSSWSFFNAATANVGSKGFAGGVFDGRYVFFVPHFNGALDGVVTRYDTHGAFTSSSAWTTFDVSGIDSGAVGFTGAVFDGEFIYFVDSFAIVARFDDHHPPGFPPAYGSSFF